MSFRLKSVIVSVVLLLAACASSGTPVAEPTQQLIPPTITDTPLPLPATSTPLSLPRPGDLAVTPDSTSEVSESASPVDDQLANDPVAAELAALAQRRVAQDLNLPTRRVQIVDVTAFAWVDTSLGCPLPGETYSPGEVDGYRIVLSAGEQEYIFHTDFDRVIPCDPANEQLPSTD